MPRQIGHARKVQPSVLTAVVSEDGINEPHVKLAEGPCVQSADPAIIFFHALHVLRENDSNKLVDELVGAPVEKVRCIWGRPAGDGQIFLDKHVSAGQRAQEAKTVHIFGQGCVKSIHADKLHVVFAAKSKHLILTAQLIESKIAK